MGDDAPNDGAAGDGTIDDLVARFGDAVTPQATRDGMPTVWITPERALDVVTHLRRDVPQPYGMLYDLTAVDDRVRQRADGGPQRDFSVVYQLLSLERARDVRIKVPLHGETPELPSLTPSWPAAGWYEREVWDMFGIRFGGHPNLRRILMPTTWQGHPLRKEHPARATELPHFELTAERQEREEEALRFDPAAWGLQPAGDDSEFLFLNVGPQHPGTHGVLRIVLQLAGERIVDAIPDIGFHHRGAEKMAERQSWHTYIPYTDRVDYLGGVMNNLPYVMAVEQLAGIEVPPRAQVIRIMLCEVFRIASHLVWYGTFAQDVGALSPVFYMFSDRERALGIIEAVCGDRMHPNWFRIGGVAEDLPQGWERLVRDFLDHLPKQLRQYDRMVMRNRIFRARTVGVGAYDRRQAEDWGVTGPGLRATGLRWDLRKQRPYGGYDQFEFEVPTAEGGDCHARAAVRVEEMRQSLRIIAQCVEHMPGGEYKSDHPLTTPPRKPRTMEDIETLIDHFLGVSWGPVIPAGEASVAVEATKGMNSYYLTSDGGTHAYRARIRAPTFPHMQMVPEISRGHLIPDLLAILGSIDFVLADIDR